MAKRKHDPVRRYLARQEYAAHVIEGGLDYLIAAWERTVDGAAREIPKNFDAYLNAMIGREILEEALTAATNRQQADILPRLAQADRLMWSLLVPTKECFYGGNSPARLDFRREIEWWFFMRPTCVDDYWPAWAM